MRVGVRVTARGRVHEREFFSLISSNGGAGSVVQFLTSRSTESNVCVSVCVCVCLCVSVCVCVFCLYTSIDCALSFFFCFSSPSASTTLLLPLFFPPFFRLLDRCLSSLTQEAPAVQGPDEVPGNLGEGNSSPSAMLATFLEVI